MKQSVWGACLGVKVFQDSIFMYAKTGVVGVKVTR